MQTDEIRAKMLALEILGLFHGARPVYVGAPIEILHKYFLSCREYEEFVRLIDKALPKDIFDDDHWLMDLASRLEKDGKKKDAANLKNLVTNFEKLRTFMYENKIFNKHLAGYPNPDVDAIVMSEILLQEMNKNVKK